VTEGRQPKTSIEARPPEPAARGPVRPRLVHDRLTLSLLTVPAMFGWYLYAFGAMASLLRAEQGTSRAVSGLHGTALAIGSVVAGLVAVRFSDRFGRRAVLIGAALTCATGLLLLVLGHQLPWTLLAALLTGSGGVLAMNTMTTVLTVHHRGTGTSAVSEAHAVAPLIGLFAPLAVGALVNRGLGWRPAFAVSAVLAVLCVALLARLPHTAALDARSGVTASGRGSARNRLPLALWAYCLVTVIGVAVEFSTSFWAVDLLRDRHGASRGTATATLSAMVLGLAVGRLCLGRLALRFRSELLLAVSLPTSLIGCLVVWASPSMSVALAGLLLAGLGYAGLYPLGATLMVASSGARADRSYAIASTGNGLALGVTPFALGALADSAGLQRGFLLIPALLVVASGAMLCATRRPGRGLSGVRHRASSGLPVVGRAHSGDVIGPDPGHSPCRSAMADSHRSSPASTGPCAAEGSQ
jgi:MFS family permease